MLRNRNLGLTYLLIVLIVLIAAVAAADVSDTLVHNSENDRSAGEIDMPAPYDYSQILIGGILVLIGWALGVISGVVVPLVIDGIRRRRSAKQVRKGLFTRLEGLRYRAAHMVFQSEVRLDPIDPDLLSWLSPIVTNYGGPDKDEELDKLVKAALDSDKSLLNAWKDKHVTPEKHLAIDPLGNPQLAQQMNNIALLSSGTQMKLLNILDLIYMSDHYSQRFWTWLQKSFDETYSESDHSKINANVEESIKYFTAKSRNIVDAITDVLPDLE
jgi:hypothetical protein